MTIGKTMRTLAGALSLIGLLVGISTFTAHAASKEKIDRRVTEVMSKFREDVNGADSLLAKASAVLVFPSIKKAGIGIGAEYGEGALLIDGKTVDYYSTAAGSIGLQLGGQVRSQILLFMAPEKLDAFRKSDKWEVGVDGSVAVATVGAGGSIDSTNIDAPILAFIFNNKGLMYNLSLEGSKMSRIERN